MKKFVVLFLIAAFVSLNAFAAESGTLSLSGSISPTLSVVVAAFGTANTTLDLTTTPSGTGTKVGTATFTTNRPSWKIYVTSTNSSKLNGDVGGEFLAYTFSIGTLSVDETLAATDTTPISMTAKAAGVSYDLLIKYTGSSTLAAATYTDTVTITVSAT